MNRDCGIPLAKRAVHNGICHNADNGGADNP
jgi:hypothetical protein